MKEKLSKFGKLFYKFEHTCFDNNPVITTKELKELSDLSFELDNVMTDIEAKPMAFYFRDITQQVESMIRNRNSH